MEQKKRLYRSRDNVLVAGVLAGLAEYFDHDPVLWRLAFVVVLIATGLMPGVLVYLIAWVVIPQEQVAYQVVNDGEHQTAPEETER